VSNDPSVGRGVSGAVVVYGFAAAIFMWCAWFATHLPWARFPESTSLGVVLTVWLLSCIWAGASAPRRAAVVGAGAGAISAVIGLMLLGTKLAEAPVDNVSAGLKPGAAAIAGGFVGLGIGIGLVGGTIGGLVARPGVRETDWLARFAWVTVLIIAPLIFIGGLVTSTNSGMAVPDWPNTYGSNMLLYPLGPRARPDVFFEHSHRLFGMFAGLTGLTLMVWTLLSKRSGWVKGVAVAAFILICVQGILGGTRVRLGSSDPERDRRIFAVIHGVLAQLVFGLVVALTAYLSPVYDRAASLIRPGEPQPGARRLKAFATGALHSTMLQLVFGAMYRHFRDAHSMWSHVGFSIVVVLMAAMTGFAAAGLREDSTGIGRILRRCGAWMIGVVLVQFILGWTTFSLGGTGLTAETAMQALLRTAHQANGALFLALVVIAFVWSRRLWATSGSAKP
jgi:heme a synthase